MDVAEISKRQLSFTRVICLYTDAAKPQLAISVESEPLSKAIPKSHDHFAH